MTRGELEKRLRDAGVADFADEARILAEAFCKVDGAHYVICSDFGGEALEAALCRRESGEPLQYIIGKWGFMNEVYEGSPAVLIPRQDTEVLVEWAIENLPRGARFLDLCTGSGCIAVSTLAARDDLTAVAADKYADALEVARRNAKINGVAGRVEFVNCDVITDGAIRGEFDAVISNPPYVTKSEYAALGRELYFEPRHALTDGADGLTFYRRIAEVYGGALLPHGVIAFEIGATQAEEIGVIARRRGMSAEIVKDLAGRDRVAILRKED